jgi:RHS repeat-associated protein
VKNHSLSPFGRLLESVVHLALVVIVLGAAGSFACSMVQEEPPAEAPEVSVPQPLIVSTGTDVGTLDGDLGVTSNGVANYRVPIWTPEGRNSMTPNVSLLYSSASGESPAGLGWSVQGGMSMIHRCGRSGPRYAVPTSTFYLGDGLCLDGKPLVLVAGSEEQLNAEYRTEPDTFTKVVVTGTDGLGVTLLTVYTRDGLIHQYGSTSDIKYRVEGGREFWSADNGRLDSDIVNNAFIDRYAWLQASIKDRFPTPNTIWFKYSHPSGSTGVTGHQEPILTRIEYVDTSAGIRSRAVQFNYSSRTVDPNSTTYIGGMPFDHKRVLDSIDVLVAKPGATTLDSVRFYRLTHAPSPLTERSLLAQVQECDGNSATVTGRTVACKLPSVFTYEQGSAAYRDLPTGISDVRNAGDDKFWTIKVADLNGDGRDDLIYRARPAGSSSSTSPHWFYRLATPGAATPFGPAQDMFIAENTVVADPVIADIDMDGAPDIGVPENGSRLAYYRNNNLTFARTGNTELNARTVAAALGDFGGKGQITVLRPTVSPTLSWGYRVFANGSLSPQSGGYPCTLNPDPNVGGWNNYVVDINGRGAPDFLSISDQTDVDHLAVMRAQKAPLPTPQEGVPPDPSDFSYSSTTLISSNSTQTVKYYFADLNGDGMADAIRLMQGHAAPSIMFNTGAGFRAPIDVPYVNVAAKLRLGNGTQPRDVNDPGIRIFDYDGDGKQDLVMVDNGMLRDSSAGSTVTARSEVWVISAHNGFQRERRIPITGLSTFVPIGLSADGNYPPGLSLLDNWKVSDVMDYDGDGQPDLVQNQSDGLHVYIHDGKKPDLLVAVEDGMGKNTGISYKPMVDPGVYEPGTDCSYPQRCLKRGGWLVSSSVEDNGSGSSRNTRTYKYADARMDVAGAGYVGFASFSISDAATATTTTEYYNNVATTMVPAFSGPASQARIYSTPAVAYLRAVAHQVDSTTVRDTVTDFSLDFVQTNGGATFYVRPEAHHVSERETKNGVQTELWHRQVTSTYDPNVNTGVVTGTKTVTSTSLGDLTQTITSQMQSIESTWMLGLEQGRTVSITAPVTSTQAESTTRTTLFNRDSDTGAIIEIITEPNSTSTDLWSNVVFTRDDRGTITEMLRSDLNNVIRKEIVTYDTDGVYPATFTDPVGLKSTVNTDPALGVILSSTEPNNATTSYDYDGFGRIRRVSYSGGQGATMTYARDVEAGSDPALHRYVTRTTVAQNGGGQLITVTNRVNQEMHRESKSFDASFSYVDTTYNSLGMLASITRPAKVGSTAGAKSTFSYDKLGRMTKVTRPEDGVDSTGTAVSSAAQSYAYSGLVSTLTDEMGRQTRLTYNSLGQTVKSESKNDSGQWIATEFSVGAFGVERFITRRNGAASSSRKTEGRYDILGRVTTMLDPNTGTRTYRYNAFGEVRQLVDANGSSITLTRDLDGRVTKRVDKDGTTTFTWDTASNGKGRLADTTSASGVRRQFSYDTAGRLSQEIWTVEGKTYQLNYSYDSAGRVSNISYPNVTGFTRLTVTNSYDGDSGELSQVKNATTGALYWQVKSDYVDGRIKQEAFGNAVVTDYGESSKTGRITSIKTSLPSTAATLRQWGYGYWMDGNLYRRSDVGANQHERFEFDKLDRLKKWVDADSAGKPLSGGWTVNYTVDDFGNLTRRQFVAGTSTGGTSQDVTYSYQSGTDQLITAPWGSYGYDANGNQTTRPGSESVVYTAFDLPKQMTGPQAATFLYDSFGTRAEKKKSSTDLTVYVGDGYERRVSSTGTDHVFCVMARGRTVAQVTRHEGGSESTVYLHADHLGSVDVVTDSSGAVVQKTKRDPYGVKVSNFNTPTVPTTISASSNKVRLGFTGAEQDDELGLINMNGRMYDPRLGRFITPDPIIPAPLVGQSHNRYSYVMNNPLRYRDPSGHSPDCGEGCDVRTNNDGSMDVTYPDGTVIHIEPETIVINEKPNEAEEPYCSTHDCLPPWGGDNGGGSGGGGGPGSGGGTGDGNPTSDNTDNSGGEPTATEPTKDGDKPDKPDTKPPEPPKPPKDPPKPDPKPPEPPKPKEGSVKDREKLDTLDKDFKTKADQVVDKMIEKGWDMRVVWGKRTKAENDELVKQGLASQTSKHLDGKAVDLINRKNPYPDDHDDPYYNDLSETCSEVGVTWGGNFNSRWDPTHFEE